MRINNLFFVIALVLLLSGLTFGLLSALEYVWPNALQPLFNFSQLRPFHVSSVAFWIILGGSACVYSGLEVLKPGLLSKKVQLMHFFLWILAFLFIFRAYAKSDFGGREYWEFNPVYALPIALAWILFLINFFKVVSTIKTWPVYIWMWMTGLVFFLFTFVENYLWVVPYFRNHFVTDMTIQWKVNGSLVGAWNQMLYGTAFFLMERIEGSKQFGRSRLAFAMYFLGLFNLMFNWGHHIYTLPTEAYIRVVGYAVSMTEWVFFLRIVYLWKSSLSVAKKNFHYFPYRFLLAADFWVFINMFQAILMSIPAINIYTHGTHVTVAHAMGTTIGINSMILMAACFEFFSPTTTTYTQGTRLLKISFWGIQVSLLFFWMSLLGAGFVKGIWQMSEQQIPYAQLMQALSPYFLSMLISGTFLVLSLAIPALVLLRSYFKGRWLSIGDT